MGFWDILGSIAIGVAAGAAVAGAVALITYSIYVHYVITKRKLEERNRQNSREAGQDLFEIVDQAQPNKVKKTMYNLNGEKVGTDEMTTDKYVDSDVYKGMKICA